MTKLLFRLTTLIHVSNLSIIPQTTTMLLFSARFFSNNVVHLNKISKELNITFIVTIRYKTHL